MWHRNSSFFQSPKVLMSKTIVNLILAGVMLGAPSLAVAADDPPISPATPEMFRRVAESPGPNAFFGHYDYYVLLPKGYGALAEFADPERLVERVFFAPALAIAEGKIRQLSEDQYGSLGVVSLEVTPKEHPRLGTSPVPFRAFREAIPDMLAKRGETFTVHETSLPYQAFELHITAPLPLIQVFVEGKDVVYMFTAGKDDDVLRSLLSSLKENL